MNHLVQFFGDRTGRDGLAVNADLIGSGILDSLTFVDLLVCLEELTGKRIAVENLELDHFRSIEQISAFVAQLDPEFAASWNASAGAHSAGGLSAPDYSYHS
jgi:acyl carrier protein